jgi:hypothetical protein
LGSKRTQRGRKRDRSNFEQHDYPQVAIRESWGSIVSE